jgi:hypothetical protein
MQVPGYGHVGNTAYISLFTLFYVTCMCWPGQHAKQGSAIVAGFGVLMSASQQVLFVQLRRSVVGNGRLCSAFASVLLPLCFSKGFQWQLRWSLACQVLFASMIA